MVLGAGCCVGLGVRVAWVMVKGLDGVRVRWGRRDWLVVGGDGDGGGVLERDEAVEVLGLRCASSALRWWWSGCGADRGWERVTGPFPPKSSFLAQRKDWSSTPASNMVMLSSAGTPCLMPMVKRGRKLSEYSTVLLLSVISFCRSLRLRSLKVSVGATWISFVFPPPLTCT